ncbi:MAG: hypothetical protein H6R22_1598 [Chromatiaceae bacterium]|nr:hypothetical protein [Chromatiaceae bacterium]
MRPEGCGEDSPTPASHRRGHWARIGTGACLMLATSLALSLQEPSVLLFGATLDQVNALTSLRASWDAAAPARAPNAGYVPDRGVAPGQVQSPRSSVPPRVGTWAYYAEGYARSRGCALTDSGAELEAAGPDWERHRVSCRDGRQIRVYCRYGDCTGAP